MPSALTAEAFLELSKSASTDSWSIRFSFLKIMSGAFISINLFNLLFLIITLLYKSFKSEVANLPPSRGTNGLNSGGITGITLTIIHSGLFSEWVCASRIDSTTCNRFNDSAFLCCEVSFAAAFLKLYDNSSKFRLARRSCNASAPIFAINLFGSESAKYWFSAGIASKISKYSSSVKKSKYLTSSPSAFKIGSFPTLITTYLS